MHWCLATKSFTTLYGHNSFFISLELKSPGERSGGLKPQSFLEHPVDYPQISRSSTFPFCWQSACLIFKPIYECFLPKSNLRPKSHRSLWGPQTAKNKLTAALFLIHNQMNHLVDYVLDSADHPAIVHINQCLTQQHPGQWSLPETSSSRLLFSLGNKVFESFL